GNIVWLGPGIWQESLVVNVCHLSRAKRWCGNAEDDGGYRPRSIKAGLWQVAGPRISAAGNGEQVFHSAVGRVGIGRAVGVKKEWEPGFAHRTVGHDEKWDGVGAAIHDPVGDHLALGVGPDIREDTGGRAGSARCRLRMTRPARVQVEPWSQTGVVSGNRLVLVELPESGLEEGQVVCIAADGSKRLARVHSRVAAYSWIGLSKRHCRKEQRHQQGVNRSELHCFHSWSPSIGKPTVPSRLQHFQTAVLIIGQSRPPR